MNRAPGYSERCGQVLFKYLRNSNSDRTKVFQMISIPGAGDAEREVHALIYFLYIYLKIKTQKVHNATRALSRGGLLLIAFPECKTMCLIQ